MRFLRQITRLTPAALRNHHTPHTNTFSLFALLLCSKLSCLYDICNPQPVRCLLFARFCFSTDAFVDSFFRCSGYTLLSAGAVTRFLSFAPKMLSFFSVSIFVFSYQKVYSFLFRIVSFLFLVRRWIVIIFDSLYFRRLQISIRQPAF